MVGDEHLLVKDYTGYDRARRYERDAEELAWQGWVVRHVANLRERPGCLHLMGPLKYLFGPERTLRVTYTRLEERA